MKNHPLVSVIITTYNRSHKIDNCIKGILKQVYKNLEIIIVDDCSTDNTEEFIKNNYKDKVKYIRHNFNQGVQFASNTGFKHAKGKYVAFIGDDDRWTDNNKLTEQVKILEEDSVKKYGIVTTDYKIINKEKTYRQNIKRPKNLVKHILRANGIISGSAALLRADVFKSSGMFVQECSKGTDSDVYRRIILLGYDVYFINKAMVDVYYDDNDNMSILNELGINRTIISQLYKLRRYEEFYKIYPSSKSHIFFVIGLMYRKKFFLNKNYITKKLSTKFFIKSFLTSPFYFFSRILKISKKKIMYVVK